MATPTKGESTSKIYCNIEVAMTKTQWAKLSDAQMDIIGEIVETHLAEAIDELNSTFAPDAEEDQFYAEIS